MSSTSPHGLASRQTLDSQRIQGTRHNRFLRRRQLPARFHPIEGGLAVTVARPSTVVCSDFLQVASRMPRSMEMIKCLKV